MDRPCTKCGTIGIYGLSVLCKACYFENRTKQLEAAIKEIKVFIDELTNDDILNPREAKMAFDAIDYVCKKTLEGKGG